MALDLMSEAIESAPEGAIATAYSVEMEFASSVLILAPSATAWNFQNMELDSASTILLPLHCPHPVVPLAPIADVAVVA